MSDMPVCTECAKPINLEEEIHVVLHTIEVTDPREWLYAHSECHLARAEALPGPAESDR